MQVIVVSEYNEPKHETACKAINSMYRTICRLTTKLNNCSEKIPFNKLDFGETDILDKFYNADLAVLDVSVDSQRLGLLYHKGIRESLGHSDDIVLVYSPNPNKIQDLKCFLSGSKVIYYVYDEKTDSVYEVGDESKDGLTNKLKKLYYFAKRSSREKLSDRYLDIMKRAKEKKLDKLQLKEILWNDIILQAFSEKNIDNVSTDLVVNILFSLRDIQSYDCIVQFEEICRKNEKLYFRINKNSLIMYLFAFARTRRNKNDDRNRAIEILEKLLLSKENHVPDFLGLYGRIYKDKFLESDCTDTKSRDISIKWYKKSFDVQPNIYAGINLITLLAISGQTISQDESFNTYASVVSNLIGQKGDIQHVTDYWDVASYFELQVILKNFDKANAAALRMYMLNPPIWYLKSTMFNISFLNEKLLKESNAENRSKSRAVFDFWLDFFMDAISDDCSPINFPIIATSSLNNFSNYIEGYVNISQAEDGEKDLIFDLLSNRDDLTNKRNSISSTMIFSLVQSQDQRALFIYLVDDLECHHIYFSKCERCKEFYDTVHAKQQIELPDDQSEIEFIYDLDENKRRRVIGQGTYGRVFLAHDVNNPFVKYAVKEFAVKNDATLETLRNEIKILSFLKHKHIVRYFGSVLENADDTSTLKIILEYVDGGTLTQFLLNYGPFSENVIRTYTKQILKGLEYLHDNRIVHRDIKGANILVNQYNGEVKIADFGTSKRLAGLNQCAEDSVGTVQYMAPDVINVSGQGYGLPADVWSLGCTVIEMATGKPPYSDVKNQYSLFLQIGTNSSHPKIPENLSDSLKDFLLCCFNPNPELRHTVKELLKHSFIHKRPTDNNRLHVKPHVYSTQSSQTFECRDFISEVSSNESNNSQSSNSHPEYITQISAINSARRKVLSDYIQNDTEQLLECLNHSIEMSGGKSPNNRILKMLLNAVVETLTTQSLDHVLIVINELKASEAVEVSTNENLEKLFYCLVPAINDLLRTKSLTPHQMFSIDNVFRQLIEDLVSLVCESNADLHQESQRFSSFSSMSSPHSYEHKDLQEAYLNLLKMNKTLIHQLVTTESRYSLLLKNYIRMRESQIAAVTLLHKFLSSKRKQSFMRTEDFTTTLVQWLRNAGVSEVSIGVMIAKKHTLDGILNRITKEELHKISLPESEERIIWTNIMRYRNKKDVQNSNPMSNSYSF